MAGFERGGAAASLVARRNGVVLLRSRRISDGGACADRLDVQRRASASAVQHALCERWYAQLRRFSGWQTFPHGKERHVRRGIRPSIADCDRSELARRAEAAGTGELKWLTVPPSSSGEAERLGETSIRRFQ